MRPTAAPPRNAPCPRRPAGVATPRGRTGSEGRFFRPGETCKGPKRRTRRDRRGRRTIRRNCRFAAESLKPQSVSWLRVQGGAPSGVRRRRPGRFLESGLGKTPKTQQLHQPRTGHCGWDGQRGRAWPGRRAVGGGGWGGITGKMPSEEKVVSLGQVTRRTLLLRPEGSLLQATVPETAQHRLGPKYDLGPCV